MQTTNPNTRNPIVENETKLDSVTVVPLSPGEESEVLSFLSRRRLHTVSLMSLIRDNGLASPLNRGVFYGCRDMNGHLEGVALIGHATLMETVSGRALQALARQARDCPDTHLIMGEHDRMEELWASCSRAGQKMRLACRQLLLELCWPNQVCKTKPNLQLATVDELELVMPIQAQLAFEASGVNPLQVDPVGFRERCLRRIQLDRTWVVLENGRLVFKADIVSETDEISYLEGVWLSEDKRERGFGVTCISELSAILLERSQSVCLFVSESNKRAQTFYKKCGYLFRATYETIFLPQKEQLQVPTS